MKKLVGIALIALLLVSFLLTGCRPPEVEGVVVDIQHGMYDKALEGAQKAVELYPDNAEAWYYLGFLYGRKGEFKKMNEAFDKALALNPDQKVKYDNVDVPLKKAVEQIRLNYFVQNHNSGIQDFNKANQTDDPEQRKQYLASAAKKFTAAHEAYPTRVEPLQPLALTYLQLGDTATAEKYFLETLQTNPNNDTLLSMVGEFYMMAGKLDKAQEMYDRALEINPQNVNALLAMAQLMTTKDDWEKAVTYFEKALELEPDNADISFNIGLSYYRLEKYQEAIPYLMRTLEKEPDNEKVYEVIGVCYIQGKMYEEALPFLKKAVEKFPNNHYLWNYIAIAYANLGNDEEAQKAYEKAKALESAQLQ
ncbi:MAG: tetratricopeptide repeat protein [Calditrichaeota bacterium]|nr:tetratricopeptide repeat protein [Calditrichota bacterium]